MNRAAVSFPYPSWGPVYNHIFLIKIPGSSLWSMLFLCSPLKEKKREVFLCLCHLERLFTCLCYSFSKSRNTERLVPPSAHPSFYLALIASKHEWFLSNDPNVICMVSARRQPECVGLERTHCQRGMLAPQGRGMVVYLVHQLKARNCCFLTALVKCKKQFNMICHKRMGSSHQYIMFYFSQEVCNLLH